MTAAQRHRGDRQKSIAQALGDQRFKLVSQRRLPRLIEHRILMREAGALL